MIQTPLKTRLLYQLQHTQAAVSQSFKPNKVRHQLEKTALFIPPADTPGGLGDDAMLSASMNYLVEHDFKKIGIIALNQGAHWKDLELVSQAVQVTLLQDKLRLVHAISHYSHLYCVGADMMDGHYSDEATLKRLRLVALAATLGLDTTILGFSFNDCPSPAALNALANLPKNVRICCRDAISYERLTHHLKRPIKLVADVAFLLKATPELDRAAQVVQWVKGQKASDRLVIGININNLFLRYIQKSENKELANIFVETFASLSEQHSNLSFLMIPHDNRGEVSDDSLAKDVLQALPLALQPYCSKVPFPCRAAEIKAICAELDFVLTGRMHLAIACLGQGTPVAGIAYQGKFEGLFKHFELTGMTIEPQQLLNPGALSQFMLDLLQQRQSLREQIQAKLPEVQTLARANFN